MKNNKTGIGICLGASTITFAKAVFDTAKKINIIDTLSIPHNGDPKSIFKEKYLQLAAKHNTIIVTGRKFRKIVNLDAISEPVATETALTYLVDKKFKTLASLGGENFVVYHLDQNQKIAGVVTGNKCASGTGDFFLQQIRRMNLSLNTAIEAAEDMNPFTVSGRCSVFCKSDCTHALNKGIPIGEVTAGLSRMIADKAAELLTKTEPERILLVGGVTQNRIVMKFLKQKIPRIEISDYATCFEAAGAAVYGLIHNQIKSAVPVRKIYKEKSSSFDFLDPLINFDHMVEFKKMEHGKAASGDICILGLDVGSTTTKAVVLRERDNKILGSVYLRTNGNPLKAAQKCYAELINQNLCKLKITGLGVTGSGRQIAGLHALTKGVINEIIAHATAATYFDANVDTIFEIGGQDAKYTYIINQVPSDYAMNEACSAGTGSFLEEAAWEALKVDVKDIADIAMKGKKPPNFNDQCSAFISSDIKTAFQEGLSQEDIIAGLIYSICINYINRVKGTRTVGKKIFMQGGVCYNKAVPYAMAAITGKKIIVPPEPGLMGAFGVALEIKKKIESGFLVKEEFFLDKLSKRKIKVKKKIVCKGGKEQCDRKCDIKIIEVQENRYAFGGACNRYYNKRFRISLKNNEYDYIKKRNEFLYQKYTPKIKLPDNAATVGISQSFLTNTIFPLYYNFFTMLGFKVIRSANVKQKGIERKLASFCYPTQLALGFFQDLVEINCDYYFLPMIEEMYVHMAKHHRTNFNSCCVFVSSEPYIIRQAFKDDILHGKMISPILNFAHGFETQEKQFLEIGAQVGIKDIKKIKKAYASAVRMQKQCQHEMNQLGETFLEKLKRNPKLIGIVMFGRTYNAFNDFANKGIPRKFATRGIPVIPYDMLPFQNESVDNHMYWEAGKKILKSAQIVKHNHQLFGTYITNFACAPDSMIIPQFREIMDTKPSLTLEIDSHTADAGINTRIEAAIDIIQNYRKIYHTIIQTDNCNYEPAYFKIHENQNFFITSDGDKIPLHDPNIIVVLPSMGDLATPLFAAGIKSLGINTFAMPEATINTLKKGKSYTTGKECLPFILCVGHLFDYIENYWDGKKYIAFFVNESGGPCRLGQYNVLMKQIIKKRQLRNITTLSLSNEDAYAGLGPRFAMMAWETILLGDVLDEIRSAIMTNARFSEPGMKIFMEEYKNIVFATEKGTGKVYHPLKKMMARIKNEVPAERKIEDSRFIAMCGEVFVRRDGFSHKWLNKMFAQKGFILKNAYVIEFILYLEWLIKKRLLEPHRSLSSTIEMIVRRFYMNYVEKKLKRICAESGYYKFERTRIDPLIKHSEHIIPKENKGETGLTIGVGMHETIEKLSGLINIGPFGCMPTRLTEGLLTPEMTIKNKKEVIRRFNKKYDLPEYFPDNMNIPFLSIESDGNVYPQIVESRIETFLMQAERMSALMERYRKEKKRKIKKLR